MSPSSRIPNLVHICAFQYGTMPIDVSFLSTRIQDSVCYYRIQISRDYGALTVEIEKVWYCFWISPIALIASPQRYNDFYVFNEKIMKILDDLADVAHDSTESTQMRESICDQLPPKLFSPSPGRRQIELERYLRRIVFNQRLQSEPEVLQFLELYAI